MSWSVEEIAAEASQSGFTAETAVWPRRVVAVVRGKNDQAVRIANLFVSCCPAAAKKREAMSIFRNPMSDFMVHYIGKCSSLDVPKLALSRLGLNQMMKNIGVAIRRRRYTTAFAIES